MASYSPSASPSVSPSASRSPSASPSASPSRSPSASPSVSPSWCPSTRNNFKSDPRIKSVWRFENNLNDDKGGNHLTASAGGVGYDGSTPIEGSYTLSLTEASNQWASITDAALGAGFPLKSGDSVKKASWAFWMTPTSFPSEMMVVSKYHTTAARSLQVAVLSQKIQVYWGYNSGNSYVLWDSTFTLTAGRKYHIGLAVDGIARTGLLRIWDDYNSTAYTYTKTNWGYDLWVSTAPFVIGNRGNLDTSYNFNGKVDEVAVANVVFTATDFDAIRQGTFNLWEGEELNVVAWMDSPNYGPTLYRSFLIL